MELAIRSTIEQPKLKDGKATGLIEYVDQRTYGELEQQFVAVLESIPMSKEWGDCSAYGAAEYLSFDTWNQDKKAKLPKGELQVLAREGRCEGYRLELVVEDCENNCYRPLLSVKYLSGRDDIWRIAAIVHQAIVNGTYGY
ncbi:MAG: hypothetical protein GJ680_07560 [Alteromonadaceae bacterium]|nr:hypothetical protein [Alteromonadaceae bacterium]